MTKCTETCDAEKAVLVKALIAHVGDDINEMKGLCCPESECGHFDCGKWRLTISALAGTSPALRRCWPRVKLFGMR